MRTVPADHAVSAANFADKETPISSGRWKLLRSLWAPILLGLLCLLVYNANFRQIGAGDTLPARYLPLSIWRYGTLELDPIARWVAHGHSMVPPWYRPSSHKDQVPYFETWAYWITKTPGNRLVSTYPVVAPLIVAPLYLPAVAYLNQHGWEQPRIDRVAEVMEKIAASLLAATASVIMYLLLRRELGAWSVALALAFAFGTNTWMISSQALWQHGTGELLIALALLLAVSEATPIRAAVLGGVCVAMAANRPPDALIAGAIMLYVCCNQRRSVPWLAGGAILPLAALLFYNIGIVGSVAGGYGIHKTGMNQFFNHPLWSGMAGLLVSPTRGLLIFSPFLAVLPIGLSQRLRRPGTRGLALALSVAVVGQLFIYSAADWRAGASWGPRWLTDLLPILVWMLAPATLVLQWLGRGLLIVTIIFSMVVQAIGAFWYTRTSDEAIFAGVDSSMSGAWNFRNVPFVSELRHPRAGGALRCNAVGWIDSVGNMPPGKAPPLLESGAILEGWALACERTPAQVVLLIDGIAVGSTGVFDPRPDVDAAMHTSSNSGWRAVANMRGVQPGERILQLAVKTEQRSDIRIVHERRVIAGAPELTGENSLTSQTPVSGLDAMAARAAALLRDRQNAGGYWLTSYTAQPRFETPGLEMNTFLTSMIVDFLSPIARDCGLEDVIKRARQHLGAQIEDTGLVRYHGRPDGPTIGKLGCVITPDADDTALVWRIADPGLGDARRRRMLDELSRYRDDRGLYRTWLAPRERYECLDIGRDPNPVDGTIQMHVYLLLRDVDPSAAVSLCGALKREISGEDLWVYYAEAPLLPFLRGAELRERGCEIPLLRERLTKLQAEQEIWGQVARLFVGLTSTALSSSDRKVILDLLTRIGRDDFAELRRTPPLLYHNDRTATVSRYYWSEDFGYALWLRLYQAARADAGQPGRVSQ